MSPAATAIHVAGFSDQGLHVACNPSIVRFFENVLELIPVGGAANLGKGGGGGGERGA